MSMNFKLVLRLSLFGLVMAFATVFVVPPNIEPLIWLAVFFFCAVVLAKKAPSKAPLHGFLVSLCNCVYITTAHIAFAETYLAGHPDEAAAGAKMGVPVRVMMAIMGPIIGVISGAVLALFTFIATKRVKRSA
jgi:hypothetical protein